MSDNPKEANKEMEKAIFISADCWLEVFSLLPPFQLGLGIALISHRFDRRVDEHFKTRKWKLERIVIQCKNGQNGAKEMAIVNSNFESLPIPQNPLPNKVIGFRRISIDFIDHNVITFLHRFQRFFDKCVTSFYILNENIRISEFVVLAIWPLLKNTIRTLFFEPIAFHQIRQCSPSILFDCLSLHIVSFGGVGILPEFPPDDSANASDGQAVAKWLFSPRPDNLPKVLSIKNPPADQWLATVEQIKAVFSSASSPVAFRIFVAFPSSSSIDSVVPFELTNEFTGEKMALFEHGEDDKKHFVLKRCPIGADNAEKWEDFGARKNEIELFIRDGRVDKGLLNDLPGPSGDH